MKQTILILGGGNMGGALARCWHSTTAGDVQVVERDPIRAEGLRAQGIAVHASHAELPPPSVLVLAIKPQQFGDVAPSLKQLVTPKTLLISIMAGVPLSALWAITPRSVRVMPNLAVTVNAGMSVACAPLADAVAHATVQQLFDASGSCLWVADEALLQATTAISGSGPGYLFAFMEALESAAIRQGLDAPTARHLVAHTMLGGGMLASQSPETFASLRVQVTSPGGTTEAALAVLQQAGFGRIVADAVAAALARAHALADG